VLAEKTAFFIVLLVCLITIVAFLVGPLRLIPVRKAYQSMCASNMKQIGLAFLAYAEDNDGQLPPVLGTVRLKDGKTYEQQWGFTTRVTISGEETAVPGLLSPFILNNQIFHCPLTNRPDPDIEGWPNNGLNYMYNDLAANHHLSDFSQPGCSVVIAESDHRLRNVGHAKSTNSSGDASVLIPGESGKGFHLRIGAAIGDGSIRHKTGANYGFADNHVRWLKPEAVFFPERSSKSSSHRDAKTGRIMGPDPKGAPQSGPTFQGRLYRATFHMR
jgi:prepilin-type processing-associated H-X9-DG protein